ncbi:glycosyltransferase family 2 protein [Microbacterium paludicola]|nr:glycosyltransferase family 2 protein [Microbacterium paludicola]MBF0817555.1 glycosyltransferase family 2 protein [Microbacterium paludicola]
MRHVPHELLARLRRRANGRRLSDAERAYVDRADDLFVYLRVNGLPEGRDILALAASHGRHRLQDLLAAVAAPTPAKSFRRRFERTALLQLVTLLADQPVDPSDTERAIALIQRLIERLGVRDVGKEARFRLLELLVESGRVGDLDALIEALHIGRDDRAQPHLLRANAANPFRSERDAGPWLAAVNGLLASEGLEPIAFTPGADEPFDRLSSAAASSDDDGPLVTVVIPTYDPGPRLATAVGSVLAQSHRRLQILIMDDASPGAAATDLDAWAERDPRIEVVHLPENGGPYLARNIAVSTYARGEYVTVHDDDDWSHPRRIERQVAHLEAHPDEVANMSSAVRVSDDMWFGRINGNPVWAQHALNSLMVRRTVFAEIGYWDVLNRSADAEFNDRIRAWTARRIPVVGAVPLIFYRVRWDSLSAGEFHRGYMDARRRWYFESYRHWHADELARGRAPFLPVDDRGDRPFSAPADLLGPRGAVRRIEADARVVADFRDEGVAVDGIAARLSSGQTVALLQLDSPRLARGARMRADVLALALHPGARVVSLRDDVVAPTTIVTDREALRFHPQARERLGAL